MKDGLERSVPNLCSSAPTGPQALGASSLRDAFNPSCNGQRGGSGQGNRLSPLHKETTVPNRSLSSCHPSKRSHDSAAGKEILGHHLPLVDILRYIDIYVYTCK